MLNIFEVETIGIYHTAKQTVVTPVTEEVLYVKRTYTSIDREEAEEVMEKWKEEFWK